MRTLVALAIASAVLAVSACGSKLSGTYSDENGSVVVDLKPGGTAALTIAGETKPCTYTTDQSTIKLTCDGDDTDFTVHDDGSLTGPPDSFVGELKKSGS